MTRTRTSYDVLASLVAVTGRVNRPLSRPPSDEADSSADSPADNQNDHERKSGIHAKVSSAP